jgi:hypothetical protein
MAIGWIQKSSMPKGRKPFSEGPNVAQRPQQGIIRPHKYADGQEVDGTPANRPAFKYPTAKEHVAMQRGTPYNAADPNKDVRASVNGPNNPAVHSKNTKRYGHNPTSGDIHGSTGVQPVKQIERGPGAAPIHVIEKKPEPVKVERLDYFGKVVK